jgi:hypothetical protein
MPKTTQTNIAYVFVGGTSQDLNSPNEHTTQLFNEISAVGANCTHIDGAGSGRRARNESQLALAQYPFGIPPIDEIGHALDIPFNKTVGVLLGTGTDKIVLQVMEAVANVISQGAEEVVLVGFSRGAVAVAMALDECARRQIKLHVRIRVALLDPVPGPMFLPKEITIPAFVSEIFLLVAHDERRFGFEHLHVKCESDATRLTAEMWSGVHGDIGGSTQSSTSRLIKDRIIEVMKLPLALLPDPQWLPIAFKALLDSPGIISQSLTISHKLRNFGHNDQSLLPPNTVTFPSLGTRDRMVARSPFARAALTGPYTMRPQHPYEQQFLIGTRNVRHVRVPGPMVSRVPYINFSPASLIPLVRKIRPK